MEKGVAGRVRKDGSFDRLRMSGWFDRLRMSGWFDRLTRDISNGGYRLTSHIIHGGAAILSTGRVGAGRTWFDRLTTSGHGLTTSGHGLTTSGHRLTAV